MFSNGRRPQIGGIMPGMAVKTLVAITLVGLCGVACGKKEPGPAQEDGPSELPKPPVRARNIDTERKVTVFQNPPELPRYKSLTVKHAGKAPTRLLTYRPDDKARQFVVSARVKSRELAAGTWSEFVALPEIRYGLGLQAVPAETGPTTVNIRGLEAEVGKPSQSDAKRAENAVRVANDFLVRYRKHLERRRATATIDATGRPGSLTLSPDLAKSPENPRITHEFQQLMLEGIVPLPGEPVGVGARWRAVTLLRRGPGVVTQTGEYELLSATDDRLEIRAEITQIGERQLIAAPGAPNSVSAELVALFWQIRGKLEVSLGSFTPTSGTLEVEMRVHSRLLRRDRPIDQFIESTGTVGFSTK